jgi:hypothetical protein
MVIVQKTSVSCFISGADTESESESESVSETENDSGSENENGSGPRLLPNNRIDPDPVLVYIKLKVSDCQ